MDAATTTTRRFARFEIVRKLGRSMTDVYLAFDPTLKKRVVLKLIEQSRDEYTQLVIEAERRGAQIQTELHKIDPRILEVYEYGEMENTFFVSMEYCEGRNIAELLQINRRLDPKVAARYAAEVASQLDRLHSFNSDVEGKLRAVVHGDIKPSNLQVSPDDSVRLLDFGIAKVITYTRSLTQHNLGSPTYCSPERLAKGTVDAQSDLWALGISLYEMVAGSPPYQAQDTRKLEILIQSRRPPRSLPDDCPPALAAIILKALAADIDRRYPSAAAFEHDLRAFLDGRKPEAVDERKRGWSANPTVHKVRSESLDVPKGPSVFQRLVLLVWGALIRKRGRKYPQPLSMRAAYGRQIDWLRWGSILFGVAGVFLLAFLVGRVRDEIWPGGGPVGYAHASLAEINSDWAQYEHLRARDRLPGLLSPAYWRGREMKAALASAADETIESWQDSSESSPENYDWTKAQLCLRHAVDLDRSDRNLAGKLALVEGIGNMVLHPKLPGAARSEPELRKAALLLNRSPLPHLALARLYVYAFNNVGKAMAEFSSAERMGYRVGPREQEEEGDGYLTKGEAELKMASKPGARKDNLLRQAHDDFERARNVYEPIAGYSKISDSLSKVSDDESRVDQLRSSDPNAVPTQDQHLKQARATRSYHYHRPVSYSPSPWP